MTPIIKACRKKLWLTWNPSQRSRNLARVFDAPLHQLSIEYNELIRHLCSSIWTFYILLRYTPSIVFIQNSFLLLLIIAFYKTLAPFKVIIICDCHTKSLRRKLVGSFGVLFWRLKEYSFSKIDMCIVSNSGMIKDAKKLTYRYFILPDKIPKINADKFFSLNKPYCVFICSYSIDEPIETVLKASNKLKGSIKIYCTGKIPEWISQKKDLFSNVEFTGFLAESDYFDLVAGASCILSLTTEEDCLQSGAYEALAVNVPSVLSDTKAQREYFQNSSVFVKNHPNEIAKGIKRAVNHREKLISSMEKLKNKRNIEFQKAVLQINGFILDSFSSNDLALRSKINEYN